MIVGAGQAGLCVSGALSRRGVDHVVLEAGRVGEPWRGRWESVCLVTPNWSVRLPQHPYDGDDPDGFMPRDEIVAYLERYSRAVEAPVREGVRATALRRAGERFVLETSAGEMTPHSVVLAAGAYQRPHRPAGAAGLPAGLLQIDVDDYSSPAELPDGAVLVVGSGQSGCQIAEELNEAGRETFLAFGRAPWVHRRIGDHDFVWWALESGFLDDSVDALPDARARFAANVLISGRDGGRDLNAWTLQRQGVRLLGHFAGADGRSARFERDLAESVAWGNARHEEVMKRFRDCAAARGAPEPPDPHPGPLETDTPAELDLGGFGAVVFAGGFRPDYERWVEIPGAFDALGFPLHRDCECAAADGLYFAGVHFLRNRRSSIFLGVGDDAEMVADGIARRAAD